MASRIVKYPVATKTTHEGGSTVTRYHGTPVVAVHADGSFTLKTEGWQTATTKHRINQFAPFRGSDGLYQKNRQWFLRLRGVHHPFVEGMTVKYVSTVVESVEVS